MPRRFPAPWIIEQIPGGFRVVDANGQPFAMSTLDPAAAKQLTVDEARRIASNKTLPGLLPPRKPLAHAPSRRAISCSANRRSMTANERLVRSYEYIVPVAMSNHQPLRSRVPAATFARTMG